MEPMNDRLRRWVEAEAETNHPPADARQRNWQAVAAGLGIPPGGGGPGPGPGDGGTSAATPSGTAAKSSAALKWVVGVAFVGAASTAVVAVTNDAPQPAESVMAEPAAVPTRSPVLDDPASEAEPAAAVAVAPGAAPEPHAAPEPVEPVASSAAAERRPQPKPRAKPTLADEVALIDRARAAVESGDLARVLTLTKEHATSFPRGELVPDRLNLAAVALCRQGRLDEGRALIERLRRDWPRAPVTRRAQSSCHGD